DREPVGDLLVREPVRQQPQHLDLSRGEPRWSFTATRYAMTGSGEHGVYGVRVVLSRAQLACGGLRRDRVAMRACFPHRLIRVRGVEEAGDLRRQRAARERCERFRLSEHAFGDVAPEAEPPPLADAARP